MPNELYYAIKNQIAHEVMNSHAYRNISSKLKYEGLENLAKFFEKQSEDETGHCNLLRKYLSDRNEVVSIPTVEEINFDEKTCREIIEFYLKREKETTNSIDRIITLGESQNPKDRLTLRFLEDFLQEQIEEEDTAQTMYDRIIPLCDDKKFLILFDQNFELD